MSIVRGWCLLLVAPVVATGRPPNPGLQKSSEKTSEVCSVEGVVVKSTTEEGIKSVMVELVPIGGGRQPCCALTESDGRFSQDGDPVVLAKVTVQLGVNTAEEQFH